MQPETAPMSGRAAMPEMRRMFVCLPTNASPTSFTPGEQKRFDKLIVEKMSQFCGDMVMVNDTSEYHGKIGVVQELEECKKGECMVKLIESGDLHTLQRKMLTTATAAAAMTVNDLATLKHYYKPGDLIKWFCIDAMQDFEIPEPYAAGVEMVQLWSDSTESPPVLGPFVPLIVRNKFWTEQPPHAKPASVKSAGGFAIVNMPESKASVFMATAVDSYASEQDFVGMVFDLHGRLTNLGDQDAGAGT